MANVSNTSGFDNTTALSLLVIPHNVRFWSYLLSDIPSLLCTIFILYCLLRDRTLRRALNNHTFHEPWVATKKKRFFVHYLPIGAIITYYTICYSMVYFVPTCENSFEEFLTGSIYIPCAFDGTFLEGWDLIVHQVIPTFIIVIFCSTLLLRAVLQKQRMNQPVQWRKYRKMTVQLLTISTIYMVFNAPWVLIIVASQYGLPDNIAMVLPMYTEFLSYYVIFTFPCVCCLSLPELRVKVKQLLSCGREQQQIRPLAAART